MKYFVYKPEITEIEKKYVNDCLESTWISSKGKYIDKFEKIVGDFTGSKFSCSVMNGTAALHLALLSLGIGPGDEVISSDLTYIASTNAIIFVGATPVLVDVNPLTWNIDIESLKKNINKNTKAIIVTDLYGLPADYNSIISIAKEFGLKVIEDSAESLGAEYEERKAGNLADVGILSFFGNKTITCGEGGMLLTDSEDIAIKAARIKNQGMSPDVRYFHDVLGYNFRMTNIQAAIGLAQIERIEDILLRKRNIMNWYKKYLDSNLTFQFIPENCKSSFWMVSFLLPKRELRNPLINFLSEHQIETRPFFFPVQDMPFYESQNKNPNAYELSGRGINVPSYPMLVEEDVKYISEKINKFMENNCE